ncbi:MAG: hypothetical protein DRP62_07255, partial [Planctomycetota bacterium]
QDLVAGTYVYKWYANDTVGNVNSSFPQANYLVNKAIIHGSLSGSDVTYPNSVNIVPDESNSGDSDVNYTLWRNGTLVSWALGTAPSPDTSVLAVGTYHYIFNSTGGENYSSNSSIATIDITVSKGVPTPNIYLNGSSQNLEMYWFESYIVKGNWSGGGDSDLVWNLYRNGTVVATGNPAENDTTLASGVYEFVYNTSGGANWTSAQTQKLYLTTLKKWNQTDGVIAGGEYEYDLNTFGTPIEKQELARVQDSSQTTTVNGNAYSVIPINVTWNASAYFPGDTTTFTNVNVSLSQCPSGWTCNLWTWTIPYMNTTYPTNTTNATMNKTNAIISLDGGNNDWIQNTSETTVANGMAFIKGNIKANNTDTIPYSDVNFPADQTNQYRTGWTCTQNQRTIPSISASSTWASSDYPTSCSKDKVIQIKSAFGNWQQDNLYVTLANGTAYIEGDANYTNTDTIEYTDVLINETSYNSTLERPGWTCSFNSSRDSTLNFVASGENSTSNKPIQCNKQNVIQPVNTSNWAQDDSKTTVAGSYAYVKGKSYFNNTDSVSYYVKINTTSYHNETLRRDSTWLCVWNNSFEQTDVPFSPGQAIQVSGYSVLCNKTNVITKNEFEWVADNSTEQNISYQKIVKKLNGTNQDPEVTFYDVNATYNEKSGYGNYNESTPFTISSISSGGNWERWISAENSSSIIITTWSDRYSAPEYYQNITINDTGDITFFNLTAWSNSFDDTNVTSGSEYVKYFNGTDWVDLNTGPLQTDCNTLNPSYTSTMVPGIGTFYICMQDLGGKSGVGDYFRIKVPHTSAQILQVGGLDTTPPVYTVPATINYSYPKPGEYVKFYSQWQDDVELSGYKFEWNASGSLENITSGLLSGTSEWANTTQQIPIAREAGDVISYTIHVNDTSSNWNSSSNSFVVWGWANLTEINVSGIFDNNKVNRSVAAVTCRVMDANHSKAIANYPVNFYKNNTLQATNYTNSTGYAVWYWNSYSDLGPYNLKCTITDNDTLYYNDSVSEKTMDLYVWRKLNLTLYLDPADIYRNDTFTPHTSDLIANVKDENGDVEDGISVDFWRETVKLGNTITLNGNATLVHNPSDTITPGSYVIRANTSSAYSWPSEDTQDQIIKGLLYTQIDSPSDGEDF